MFVPSILMIVQTGSRKRKSRTPEIAAGSRQRSNSLKYVYSKIPAPGPRGNSSLTLKSTSNLPRNTSFSSPQVSPE